MTADKMQDGPPVHDPVMVREVINYLKPEENRSGVYCDATTSTGGHAAEIAGELGPSGTFIGLDLDKSALQVASDRLTGLPPRIELFQANFVDIDAAIEAAGVTGADGILFDLGFSTFQIEDPERGFSFQKEGPLDMRMDPGSEPTAEDLVNEYSFEKLKDLIIRYGEERWADGIAKEIVNRREQEKITTTGELVSIIESALPEPEKRKRKTHPATKTFQALRIAVNDELNNLEEGLETAFSLLKEGGVIVVLSYHSLEDRRVKRFLNYRAKDCICPPDLPVCRCDKESEVEILTEGMEKPTREEIDRNPRARSARLRAGRKKFSSQVST